MDETKTLESVRPIDKSVKRVACASVAVLLLAFGSSVMVLGYLMSIHPVTSTFLGISLIWVGSLLFMYSVITEEHTMKELFIRESYFFTGLVSMIAGTFIVLLGGFYINSATSYSNILEIIEFGLFVMLFGAALVILSAERYRDYTQRNGIIAAVAGMLLLVGGAIAASPNIIIIGIVMELFSAIWLGLRTKKAL